MARLVQDNDGPECVRRAVGTGNGAINKKRGSRNGIGEPKVWLSRRSEEEELDRAEQVRSRYLGSTEYWGHDKW